MSPPSGQPVRRGDPAAAPRPFWAGDEAGLLETLGACREGLTVDEAARRLAVQGPNRIAPAARTDALRLLARQFESPLVLILLFGALLSLGLREWVDAGIVLAILIGSALLGFAQEHRASRAVEALQRRIAPTARVRRGGETMQVPAATLVTGDVVLLSAGNLVPADGRVLAALDCLVEEASLTGESFPVDKRPGSVPADAPQGARLNAVFVGTSVRSGTAVVLVAATGRATQFGAVAERLGARGHGREGGFERGMRDFGTLLMRVMVLMVLFVLIVNHALGRPGIESLMFSVALAVGLSPELLPAIASVTLSQGAQTMAARGTIVRRLQSIENLGGMDLLCTDKTGTLTEGTIALAAAVDADGAESAAVLRLAWLNASFEAGIENPLDAAVVAAGHAAGLDTGSVVKVAEMPYDFVRRRLTVVLAERAAPGRHRLVTKGAVDNVLDLCTQGTVDGADRPLDEPRRARLRAWCAERGAQGLRVLAVAGAERAARDAWGRDDEAGLVLAGFLLFRDPPRPDAARAIAALAALGVGTRMITGDNRWVSAHLAREVGLDPTALLTGDEIATLDDPSLRHRAARTQVFAEIDPQQKERVVRALRDAGHVVGYMGDGINDAPALHAADVGISVDGAVDVARESADVVLLQRDLGVLHDGVVEGRRTFANTMKYIEITTSANFGNMVSMAIAAPLLPFLPLTATQILLNNFLSDLPAMTIATDRVDAAHLAVPQRWDVDALRRFMLAFGLLSTLFDLATFVLLRQVFGADAATFQTGWFVVSLLTELAVLLILRTHGPVQRSVPGALLLVATAAVAAVAIALPFWPPAAALFGFVAPSPAAFASVLGVVAAYAIATEAGKRRFRAAPPRAVPPPA